ncbi:MAG: NUDIX hydrolase [Caldilineaceae bacterium]
MHRLNLLAALTQYNRAYPAEADVASRFITFVQEHADCFERSLAIGHITGSAWVVDAAGQRALFTHHRKLNRWLQPGGHADGDPDVRNVSLREAQEESGLHTLEFVSPHIFDLDAHRIPARGAEPAHIHYDVRFALRAVGNEPLVLSQESHELAWFTMAEIADRFGDESVLRMMRKWKRNFDRK